MTEDVHDAELRRYTEATTALQASIRRMIDQTPPGHPVVGCLEWCSTQLERTPYFYQRPDTELRRALWGPDRIPTPPAIPGSCYEAPWGWVHVRPGCHCPR